MEDDLFFTIKKPTTGIYKEKGSRFISFALPVTNETEAKTQLTALTKEYHDARHHCFAYILGHNKQLFRFSDDGEPSGTAGRPIYGQLLSFNVTNVLLVVIRYFGGTKLGTSGLIKAYKNAAKDALEKASIEKKHVQEHYHIVFPFPAINDVMNLLNKNNVNILSQSFTDRVSLSFSVRKSFAENLFETLSKISGVKIEMNNPAMSKKS